MKNQICIDFGTSSIRAAVSYGGELQPLKIAINSPIDNASIPSAILVTRNGDMVFFGHEAILAAANITDHLLYESSPKRWLLNESVQHKSIDIPISANHKFSKRKLLEILLSLSIQQSYQSAKKVLSIKEEDLKQFSLRISHPSWDEKSKDRQNKAYHTLLSTAAALSQQKIGWVMTGSDIDKLKSDLDNLETLSIQDIEIEEPIAASISLFGGFPKNKRAIALVIDIGAGTIDLGLFSMVVPENPAAICKLKQWAQPKSLMGAGDKIDEALLKLVNLNELTVRNAVQFKNRLRENKEMLFNQGELVIGSSIRLNLKMLTDSPLMKEMAKNLEQEIFNMLEDAIRRLSPQTQSASHRLDQVYAVFAGGGANIKFLRKAVSSAIQRIPGLMVNYDFQQNQINLDDYSIDASIERMAVALGGAVDDDKWPDTNVKSPTLKGWGWDPKQKF